MNRKFVFISLGSILLLQLIILWPSFCFALYGDDWLAFWHLWSNSDPVIGSHLYPIRYFLTPYGPQDMNMGLLRMLFGYYSLPYYITSFIWRLSVSYALFFMTLKFFKNKTGALFAGIFFSVSVIGLEATDWVFNMTSYLGLLFYVIFFYFFCSSRQTRNVKVLLLSAFFLFLAIITVPIRMHGGVILLIFAEVIFLLLDQTSSNLRYTLFRISIFTLTIMIIKMIGTSLGDPNESVNRMMNGVTWIAYHLKLGQIEVLLYPIMTFGNMIFPQLTLSQSNLQLRVGADSFFPLSIVSFTVFTLLLFLLTPKENKTKKTLFKIIFIGLIYNIIVWLIFNNHTSGFSLPGFKQMPLAALLGGYITILLGSLVINKCFEKKYLSYSTIIIFWPYAFFLFAWITLNTANPFPEYHRYLIMSSAGIGLIWAMLASLKINRKILIILFSLHLLIQIYSTYSYLGYIAQRRNRELSEKIWHEVESGLPAHFDGKKIYVVLFLTETQDMNYFHGYFDFGPRIALRDRIRGYGAPIGISDYNQLVSAVTDGKMLKSNGHDERPISPDQTITFLISGQNIDNIRVQNMTEQTRKDLVIISEKYLKAHPEVSYQE